LVVLNNDNITEKLLISTSFLSDNLNLPPLININLKRRKQIELNLLKTRYNKTIYNGKTKLDKIEVDKSQDKNVTKPKMIMSTCSNRRSEVT